MRAWIWTLIVLIVAVTAAVLIRDTTGSVVIVAPPYRLEVSLVFAVLAILVTFAVVYVLLRLAGWSAGLLPRWRSWRVQRQLVREHQRLEQGWVRFQQGQYVKARDEFLAVSDATRDATRLTLAHLGVASAVGALNEQEALMTALENASRASKGNQGLRLAVACTAAELLLQRGDAQGAARWLALVQDTSSRHVHYLRLAVRCNLALGQWQTALSQARTLARHHDLQGDLQRAVARAAEGYLRSAADGNEALAIWKRLKAQERLDPAVALAGAEVLRHDPVLVRNLLQDALEHTLEPSLLQVYARCEPAEVRVRLHRAETWLSRHPDNPDLLQALGTLCMKGELWGPATSYLQRSLQQRDDARTHALLGTLYDHLGQPAEATRHWRLATALQSEVSAITSQREVLPVADTRADPPAPDGLLTDTESVSDALPRVLPDSAVVVSPESAGERDDEAMIGAADLPPREEDLSKADPSPGRSA